MTTKKKVIRVQCGVKGLEENWVEYDVSQWTNARYFREISDANVNRTLPDWLEPYCVGWNIVGIDGELVPHPGRITDDDGPEKALAWLETYEKVSLDIVDWLCITAYLALSEVVSASRKRTRQRKTRRTKGRRKS